MEVPTAVNDEVQYEKPESEDIDVKQEAPEDIEMEFHQNVGSEVDQKIENEEFVESPTTEQQQSPTITAMLESNGTLNMDDLRIEQEEEQEAIAQERVYEEEDYALPEDLFFGLYFYAYGKGATNSNYTDKITKCGGTLVPTLDSSVTHILFQDK
jgi:hypothetical protein